MEEHDKIRRWKAAIEIYMKVDFDAKVEAIRDALIAEETRQLHSRLSADLQEAQAQAAEEYSKLIRAKAANIKEMEALRLARAQLNDELRRSAAMGENQLQKTTMEQSWMMQITIQHGTTIVQLTFRGLLSMMAL